MSLKFTNFVLVQVTQSNVLPLNGYPPESTLLHTARYAQLFISRFALLTHKHLWMAAGIIFQCLLLPRASRWMVVYLLTVSAQAARILSKLEVLHFQFMHNSRRKLYQLVDNFRHWQLSINSNCSQNHLSPTAFWLTGLWS